MASQPRPPSDHYAEAERLLRAAESSATEQNIDVAALTAIGHAILATVPPRRAPRRERPHRTTGGSPQERWLRGE
jgi:hypothetical protein